MKIRDLFKRRKQNNTEKQIDIAEGFEVQIEGNINLFEGEEEKIIKAAKQLLEIGRAEDMEDAILTIGVMFRGLKFSQVQKTKDGKTIIVFSEVGEKGTQSKREELVDVLSNNGEYLSLGDKKEIVSLKDFDDGEIYYKIGDKEYRIPVFKTYIENREGKNFPMPLEKRSENKYLILDEQMTIEDKHTMLQNMLDRVLMYITILVNQILEDTPNQELREKKDKLCRTSEYLEYFTKKLCSENRIEEANEKLIRKIEEVLKLNEQLLENDKDIQI